MDQFFSWLGLGLLCLGASGVLWVVSMFKTRSDPKTSIYLDALYILLALAGFLLVAFSLISYRI